MLGDHRIYAFDDKMKKKVKVSPKLDINLFVTFIALWANLAADKLTIFFLIFSQKIGFGNSCRLSPMETICIKCQSLLSRKNNKIIQNVIG